MGPGDIPDPADRTGHPGPGHGIVPAGTRGGHRNLFTVGGAPEIGAPWSSYAPSAITLPDGSVKLSTVHPSDRPVADPAGRDDPDHR